MAKPGNLRCPSCQNSESLRVLVDIVFDPPNDLTTLELDRESLMTCTDCHHQGPAEAFGLESNLSLGVD